MKNLFILVSAVVLSCVDSQAQNAIEKMKGRKEIMQVNRELQNEKISESSKMQAKQMTKDGWRVMPGQLILEQQIERSALFQNQFEDDLITPKYVWGDATTTANNYDAGKMQALELARQNMAGSIEQNITQIIEHKVDNHQGGKRIATSLANSLKQAMTYVETKLGQSTPVIETYRKLSNGDIEVRVQIFYSMDEARRIAREAIREQMEKNGQTMSAEQENLLK